MTHFPMNLTYDDYKLRTKQDAINDAIDGIMDMVRALQPGEVLKIERHDESEETGGRIFTATYTCWPRESEQS